MKKKQLILFLIFCFLLAGENFIRAQATDWDWAKAAAPNGGGEGMSVCADPNGAVFITGEFTTPSITFGNITLTNTFSNGNSSDIYLVKYDGAGNVLWAKSAGGNVVDVARAVATDKFGNAYVTGYFTSPTITFGSFTLTSSGTNKIFLVKYDPSGNVVWAKSAGGTGSDAGIAVTTDVVGNIYITGDFTSPTISFGSFTLNNLGQGDIFIAKYDGAGNLLWAKSAGGSGDESGYSIASDSKGNIFLSGFFKDSVVSFDSFSLANAGGADMFLTKYDSAGNVTWAKVYGGTNDDVAYSVATDTSGNVFMTGWYYSTTITFDNITLNNSSNFFITKFDGQGNALWAKTASGGTGVHGYCVATDVYGNVFVTGGFGNFFITFPPVTIGPQINNTDPMFLVKYNPSGNIVCLASLASGGDDQSGVSVDYLGNAYITGDFLPSSFIVGNDTLITTSGIENIFLARYSCISTLGHQEISEHSDLQIFPNPSNGIFTVKNSGRRFENFEIRNTFGEVIYKSSINQTDQIDLSNQPDGIYFILIKTNSSTEGKKIIICR